MFYAISHVTLDISHFTSLLFCIVSASSLICMVNISIKWQVSRLQRKNWQLFSVKHWIINPLGFVGLPVHVLGTQRCYYL